MSTAPRLRPLASPFGRGAGTTQCARRSRRTPKIAIRTRACGIPSSSVRRMKERGHALPIESAPRKARRHCSGANSPVQVIGWAAAGRACARAGRIVIGTARPPSLRPAKSDRRRQIFHGIAGGAGDEIASRHSCATNINGLIPEASSTSMLRQSLPQAPAVWRWPELQNCQSTHPRTRAAGFPIAGDCRAVVSVRAVPARALLPALHGPHGRFSTEL